MLLKGGWENSKADIYINMHLVLVPSCIFNCITSTLFYWWPEGFSSHLLFHTFSCFFFYPLSALLSFGLEKVGSLKPRLILQPGPQSWCHSDTSSFFSDMICVMHYETLYMCCIFAIFIIFVIFFLVFYCLCFCIVKRLNL